VGTAGVGNHSHNDLFAPSVWAGGREWICDPGTGTYTPDPALRNRMRSTAAHATLQLGSREQNRFGDRPDDLFLMTSRARPEVTDWSHDEDGARLVALHRGFGDAWTHSREVRLDVGRRSCMITDRLWGGDASADDDERVFLRFPVAPGVEATPRDRERWPASAVEATGSGSWEGLELGDADGRRFWIFFELPHGSRVEIEASLCSPRYGVTVPSRVVVAVLPLVAEVRARTLLHAPAAEARR
jgi:hypothetical protein